MKLKIIFSLCVFSLISSLFAQNQREREYFNCNCGVLQGNNGMEPDEDLFVGLPAQIAVVNGVVFEVEDLPDDEDFSDDSMDVEDTSSAMTTAGSANSAPTFTRQEALYRIHYNRYFQRALDVLGNGLATLRNYVDHGVVTESLGPLVALAHQEGDSLDQVVQNANLNIIEFRVEGEVNALLFGGEDIQYPENVTGQEYLDALQRLAQYIQGVLGNNPNTADPLERRISRLVWATAFVYLYMDVQAFIEQYPVFNNLAISQMLGFAHSCNAMAVATMYTLLKTTPRVFMTIRVLSPEGARNIFVQGNPLAAGHSGRLVSLKSFLSQNNTQSER